MSRTLRYSLTVFALFAAACGGCDETMNNDPAPGVDAAADDIGGGDIGGPGADGGLGNTDAAGGEDAGSADMGGAGDAGSTDAGSADMGSPDAAPSDDGGMTDTSVCGDGAIEGTEICDDGNTDDGDYCAADCSAETGTCGDGTTQTNEACDDGNTSDGDYCSADCTAQTGSCGDGMLQVNENCDDGATTDCAGTHDGGDGACVAIGTCSNGYTLDGNGVCVSNNTTGLPTPCSLGAGQALFKFHYDSGSTSARIDVWDASCSYSFAPNSACNVREVYPGFGDVGRTSQGYPILTSSEYIRVRYSVAGINFSQATLYVQARSYSTGASTNIEAWSPIYGGVAYGPVDNDFVYDWYAIDWSGHLSPGDDPNLTAIQLYAYQGSNSLAVRGVELCLQ